MGRVARDWFAELVTRAEGLAESFGGKQEAVALNSIAAQRNVQDVVFRPLLVAGALAVRENGFAIYVKSDKCRAREYRRDFFDNGGLGLKPRVRFSIAHELVHTLLYDTEASPPVSRLRANDAKTHARLEWACNHGANRMLVPRDRVHRLVESEHFFEPSFILDFTRRIGASVQAVVIRLAASAWRTRHGGLALLGTEKGSLVVLSSGTDNFAAPCLPWLSYRQRTDQHLPPVPRGLHERIAAVAEGSYDEQKHWDTGDSRYEVPLRTRWVQVGHEPPRWLLTVEMTDAPRVVPR